MSYKGIIDFRSDTVTRPTEEMRKAMYIAEVGDDVHGDDPTVNRLEELAAAILKKEAALFVPSGTMGNTIAIKLGAGEGKGVILEEKCHIMNFEAGNISRIALSLPQTLPSEKGEIPLKLIEENICSTLRDHMPETRMIALENTHNVWGGTILSQEYIKSVSSLAKKHNLHMHLDGARMFNASVAQGIEASDIAQYFDTVMFCLSKGLAAPIGSILAGSENFIMEARKTRKSLGGGMRQVGIVAAAGIISLEIMVDRLYKDHQRAKKLAKHIQHIKHLEINPDDVETNFLMLKVTSMTANEFLDRLAEKNILALPFSDHLVRLCTHKDIEDRDIDHAIIAIQSIFSGK